MSSQPPEDGRRRSVRAAASTSTAAEQVYDIEAIICRSLEPAIGPSGKEEYYYLVRWDGYGPEYDTWEPRSNLGNSTHALKEYEVKETPFSIMDVRTYKGYELSYLVRFGLATKLIPPSPHYPKVWMSVDEMKQYCRVTTVNNAIKQFQRVLEESGKPKTPKASPKPKKITKARKYVLKSARRDVVITASRKKQQGKGAGQWDQYYAEWEEKGQPMAEWLGRSDLVQSFGSTTAGRAIKHFREQAAPPPKAITSMQVNEYERERQRNIEENQRLLRDLGL